MIGETSYCTFVDLLRGLDAMVAETFTVGPDDDPDKYRLRRHVGGGGEAELWEGDVALAGGRERVAVKVLRTEHIADVAHWRQRWAEQADLLRLIRHPGVVGVHAQFEGARMHAPGQGPAERERVLYLVMNWVDGQALRDWVPLHRDFADRVTALRILGQLAAVLDWLHSGQATTSGRPVIHGDISPANVILNADGQAVLVDFGLFRVTRHITEVGVGTRGYCAPEIIRDGAYSPASDRYAFGGLAFYLLTGVHPPADPTGLRAQIGQVAAYAEQNVDVIELATIFADDPAERPSARQWLGLLRMQTSTGGLPPTAPRMPADNRPTAPVVTAKKTLSPWLAAIGSGVAVGVIAVGLWLLLGRDVPETVGAPPTPSLAGPSTVPTSAPAAAATSAGPQASPSSPAPSAGLSPWPGEPAGKTFISGTVELSTSKEHFDLDQNEDGYDLRSETDLTATDNGLGAQNGAILAPWTGSKVPTLAECRRIPDQNWIAFISNAVYEKGQYKHYCVNTTDGRYGYLDPKTITYSGSGRDDAYEFEFVFVLWKHPDDR